ncbi:MAG: GH25 family lysozyme [bacterium]|nr:GH25 family lysozyme [bacterium]
MIKLIDVSKHNGKINWTKVKKAGIKGAILRAGYGKSTVDAQFVNNAKGAIAAGIPIGIYWFSYAYTVAQAEKEAEMCIKTIKGYKITLPVFFDWEYDSMRYAKQKGVTPGKTLITNMNKAFCEKVKKAGYKPGVYYNRDYKNNYMDVSKLKSYVQWYAYYSSTVQKGYDIHQYTASGRVDGISSKVDLNYLINEDLLSASSNTKTTTTTQKTTTTTSKRSKKEVVKALQTALNQDYNCKLDVDGSYGPKTKAALKAHNITKKSKSNSVKFIQRVLKELGFKGADGKVLSIDGDFGPNTEYAVKTMQKKYKVSADGLVGTGTMDKLLAQYK